jgi:HAD superfamily hydrolase (TIGR01459 family)
MTDRPGFRPPAARAPTFLSGLAAVARTYDGFIIDLWGTIHDGVKAYAAAIDVLARLRAQPAPVCLLSNAARSVTDIAEKLASMGVDRGCYDHLVSSGQATIAALRRPDGNHGMPGVAYYFIGPEDGAPLLQGLGYIRVDDPGAASFILNTGSEPGTDLSHYERALRACARTRLPMICANPDLFVKIGGRHVMCAGTIARRYEALLGKVRYYGKPDPAIYWDCLERMQRPADAVLVIGDGPETDIAGAHAAGMDSVFVLGGLHADFLSQTGAVPAHEILQPLFAGSECTPTYVMPYLRW